MTNQLAATETLTGTVALVTGGAHGLGRVMVEALTAQHASVLIFDANSERIGEVCRAIKSDVYGYTGDVSHEDDAGGAIAACIDRFGHIDVVVNNAGILSSSIPRGADGHRRFSDLSLDIVQRFFEVHVIGTFLTSRAAVGHMVDQGWGRIITVTTSLGTMIRAEGAPYGPAKAAMEAFTSVMAHELQGTGVTANVLIPGGGVDTRDERATTARHDRPRILAEVMGPPVVWLASRDSDAVTARRFLAKDWDPALPGSEAAEQAGAPIAWPAG